ncbi:MAG: hypothetical protein EPO39_00195 [Candidatus Manganitrophaceae bacterium]|nr:MAG: hypothetical protein EPO39_00195 [Candidatus Manganitrophaceae bacterium]
MDAKAVLRKRDEILIDDHAPFLFSLLRRRPWRSGFAGKVETLQCRSVRKDRFKGPWVSGVRALKRKRTGRTAFLWHASKGLCRKREGSRAVLFQPPPNPGRGRLFSRKGSVQAGVI